MGKIDEIKEEFLEEKAEIEKRLDEAEKKYNTRYTRKAVAICSGIAFIAGVIVGAKWL